MAVNSAFHTGSSTSTLAERNLYQELITESIQIFGHDCHYIDRESVGEDTFLGEDALSKFVHARKIEMYTQDVNGWEGDDLLGTVEVLSTPAGNILKELFKSGIKLGISSRGLGSVEPVNEAGGEGTVAVQPDFELIAFDFVSNPSTHGAFMYPMNESVGGKNELPKYHKVNRIINDIIAGE